MSKEKEIKEKTSQESGAHAIHVNPNFKKSTHCYINPRFVQQSNNLTRFDLYGQRWPTNEGATIHINPSKQLHHSFLSYDKKCNLEQFSQQRWRRSEKSELIVAASNDVTSQTQPANQAHKSGLVTNEKNFFKDCAAAQKLLFHPTNPTTSSICSNNCNSYNVQELGVPLSGNCIQNMNHILSSPGHQNQCEKMHGSRKESVSKASSQVMAESFRPALSASFPSPSPSRLLNPGAVVDQLNYSKYRWTRHGNIEGNLKEKLDKERNYLKVKESKNLKKVSAKAAKEKMLGNMKSWGNKSWKQGKRAKYFWSRRLSGEKGGKGLKFVRVGGAKKTSYIVSPSGKRLIRKSHLTWKWADTRRTGTAQPMRCGPNKYKIFRLPKVRQNNCSSLQVPTDKAIMHNWTKKKFVNINGIVYRASYNKLTRTGPDSQIPSTSTSTPKLVQHSRSKWQSHVIRIRNDRFLVSDNGNKLTRLSEQQQDGSNQQPAVQRRIYFGGVTFQPLSGDVLVRSQSERTRQVLTSAVHRSIALLNAHNRKINSPCVIHRRLGRCSRHQAGAGACPFTHHDRNIDLCKRFLRGECTDAGCLLSHQVDHHKVPTCKYFLEGVCGRDSCPYLHVKLSSQARICPHFIEGYCPHGDQCSLRHTNICPEFEKGGACKRGNKCPYPHTNKAIKHKWSSSTNTRQRSLQNSSQRGRQRRLSKNRKKSTSKPDQISLDVDKPARYYLEKDGAVENVQVLPKRSRLASLPSFIGFENDEVELKPKD